MQLPGQKTSWLCSRPGCSPYCTDNDVNTSHRWSGYEELLDSTNGADYVTVQDIKFTKFNGEGLNFKANGSDYPDYIEVLRNEVSWIGGGESIIFNRCQNCTMKDNISFEVGLYSGECTLLKASKLGSYKGCAESTNPCGPAEGSDTGTCAEFGGSALYMTNGSPGSSILDNLIYNVYGECVGIYHNWDPGLQRVQGNESWNCMSAPYHATGQEVLFRWNLGGYYDPDGDKDDQHWFQSSGGNGAWPDCNATGKSGLMPVYDSSTYPEITEYPIIGNLLFGQWTDNLGWNTGPSHSINNADTPTFNVWWLNNTVVDAVRNYRIYEQNTDDGEQSYQYFNTSVFYGADTPLTDGDYFWCYVRDIYGNRNDTKWNNWGSTSIGVSGCYSSGNDVIGDPDLEEQDAADWLFPPDRTTISWRSFRPTHGSLLIDQSEQSAYTALVDASDTCGGGSCGTVIVEEDVFFWVGDYITIANPANMSGTRTNTTYVTSINRSTNTLTLNASITIDDAWYVILNPYKWASKTQDTATGWYGDRPDWGAIEYAIDDPPSITAPTGENQATSGTMTISRSALAGVPFTHIATSYKICTSGACADCSAVWSDIKEETNKLSTSYSGLNEDTNYITCAQTFVDWDEDTVTDDEEASQWQSGSFNTGAQPQQSADANTTLGTGVKSIDLGIGTTPNADIGP
jgi:hypothetical protein